MSRRPLVLGLVVLLVVLAGCIGGGSPSDSSTADVDAGDSSNEQSGTDEAGEDEVITQWERFTFEEGEYYRYRVNDIRNDETATITWDVLSVDGEEVTAEITYDNGTDSFSRTVTGQNATILFDLRDIDPESEEAEATLRTLGYLSLGPFSPMTAYYQHRDLKVGNSWRLSGTPDAGYMTANVEGRTQYAGQDCYETAIRVPDTEEWEDSYEFESCISPDASLALYTAYYGGETGEMTVEIVLEEYRSG
ncbi:hypothetical protein [Haloprofundus salinisoli]|uniref:hypothetical protein n=1 Tax=Haloprofundus salinisoli TaxID=2876193 RepID=UPI001CCAC41A|nr:hypothetical protein [Haloprofundus salinisoli]